MKLAFLYAGQGSQTIGMGRDFYEKCPSFKAAFDNLSPALRLLCFDGSIEALSQTENAQPCMVAFALGVTAMLFEKGIFPSIAAGLSLGEYSALNAAGVFSAKEAIELVRFRGEQMAKASMGIDCKMIAVLKLDRQKVQQCCFEASDLGLVQIANFNCPGQIVISGESCAVDKAAELALSMGARRCLPLAVSGPFHTKLMHSAGIALKEKLLSMNFNQPSFPIIFNCTAKPLSKGETIADLLERQVQSSVYFEDTIKYMENDGVDTIIEIGPGKVLSGFVKNTSPAIKTFSIENCAGFESALEALGIK